MYLKRKIDSYLVEWKANENRKPLIIKGPRQIGKTESVKKFAEANYDSVIEINFVLSEKYKMITSDRYEDISYGIKLCAGNIGMNDNLYTFPYYCTFLLKRYLAEK